MTYLAVVLDRNSSKKVLRKLPFFPTQFWTKYGHHMTICMGTNKKGKYNWEVGEEVTLAIDAIGISDMACAARVILPEGKVIKNAIPHITLAVNTAEGGKPKMSNDITKWDKEVDLTVKGVVELCG